MKRTAYETSRKPPYKMDRVGSHVNNSSSSDEDDDCNENYAEKYVKEEMQMYANCFKQDLEANTYESGLTVDDITDEFATTDIRSEVYRMARMPEVYSKYNFDEPISKKKLAISSYKEKILKVIKTNAVVIIDGPTGCGKTTQVPQYILDDCRLADKDCNIVVTQPRKIATINVAKRVCSERGWTLGTVCGYQVGLQKELGPDVILSYMTTGVLLQKLIASKSLSQYTHIIIDEVHERNQDLDFLLLVVRRLLFTKSFHTKVILMSATIDAEEFAYYFRGQFKGADIPAPIIHIKERSVYSLTTYYLDHLPQVQSPPSFDENKPEISQEILNTFMFLMSALDNLDEQKETNEKIFGSVLVFLPGIREIEDVEKLLKDRQNAVNVGRNSEVKWDIIPLHSSLPNDDQARVFNPVKPPLRKIILSTNIAESSITVPDVTYVVDFCLTKTMVVDKITKFSSLHLEWASHVSCDQRAGRAGRVRNGRVYRLVPKGFYDNHLQKRSVPEMLRAPLEIVVLHTKMLELSEEPKAVLALALSPPNLSNIENTIWHLKEIGGMLKTCRGRRNLSDGDITFLGIVMASLPLEVCLSKLIVLGHMFSVLNDAIIMAAGCSIQNIFATPYHERLQSYNKKLLWADGSCSDLMALLNLYKVWQAFKRDGAFRRANEEFSWCKKNFVSLKSLREWHLLIGEIRSRLKRLGIEETAGPARVNLTIHERITVLKVVICGAFYPNYFIKSTGPKEIDEREAVRTVGGRDPYKTVYLSGIEPGQPAALYTKEIKKMLDIKDNAKVEFDGSSKIYIEFRNYKEPETVTVDGQQFVTTIPGKIAMPVYHAVKRRQLKMDMKLNVLPTHIANEHVAVLEKQQRKLTSENSRSEQKEKKTEVNCFSQQEFFDPIPSIDTEYITVCISHRIDAANFFCQNIHDSSQEILTHINRILNTTPLQKVEEEELNLNDFYVALFLGDNQYYRIKIHDRSSKTHAHIFFIDYGNTATINIKNIYALPDDPIMSTPPIAFECVLIEVQPAWDVIRKGIWSDHVNNLFDEKTQNAILHGKVYSVCDDVVHLELFRSRPDGGREESINQWLINNNHARKVEESFLSKQNHELRQKILQSENPYKEAQITKKEMTKKKETIEIDANMRGVEKFLKEITLKGPNSPLEMKICSVVSKGQSKLVDIEASSVNSVLLDSDPVDSYTRLIVAGYVKQSPTGNVLNLRQTTIMPNIPGFPFLMAMLFCPQMEPKLSSNRSVVSALLCGLGVHNNSNKSCFPAHDMVLVVDTEITEEIVNAVNEIRFSMNTFLDIMKTIYELDDHMDHIEQYQRSIKTKIFQLLRKKMKKITPHYSQNLDAWKETPADVEILNPPVTEELIWPLHWFVKVKQIDDVAVQKSANLEQMDMLAKKVIPFENVTCMLCEEHFTCIMRLRMHIISLPHKLKYEDFKYQYKLK